MNIVTIVAWAGVGKSTLANHWLRRMAANQYRSAELIFGWSFYRQGSSGGTSTADEFLDAALTWFGDLDARIGTPWEKGERLTNLIPTEWRKILAKLRRARLLAGEDPQNRGYLDAHPLVREYFGGKLRSERSEAWTECNRRLYEYYRKLAPHLPDSFREMEPLFSAVICGCNAGLLREALNEIYIPRIQRDDALFAGNVLGARGALLSVLAHFFENGKWGLPAATGVEGQTLIAEDQLYVLMQAGLYLAATQGLGSPDALICYEYAVPLCQSLNRPLLLGVALTGQWRYSLMTDKLRATMQIAERVYALAQEQKNAALLIGAHRALAITFYFLGDLESTRQHALNGIQIWRAEKVQSYADEHYMPPVGCLCYLAGAEWCLGAIAASQTAIAEAISTAKKANDIHALALALYWAARIAADERNTAEVERLASDLIELSTRHNFVLWLATGEIYHGWARSLSGNTAEGISWIEQGIKDFRATGAVLTVPFYLALKADALYQAGRMAEALVAINEADALSEVFEQRFYCVELRRLRGVVLAAMHSGEAEIEASFCEAMTIAQEQKSASLAKRVQASYEEYRRTHASPLPISNLIACFQGSRKDREM